MGDPRPEKVAIVDEVERKFDESDGALLTEYRGLSVKAMQALRASLREAGGEYKIYKNTLVRIAATNRELDLDELLTGPTAIAFVEPREDGSPGDAAAVAKALKTFAKSNDKLVLKGGVLDDKVLSAADVTALADLPSREVLLAQLAGAFQAPMAKLAGLLSALPRDFAYGLKALIDQGGAGLAPAADTTEAADDAAEEETPAEASAEATVTDEPAGDDDTPAADAGETNEEEE